VRRLFIFAHFDRDHIIDPYVIHYISALSQLGGVIFVSTSQLSQVEIAKLRTYTIQAISRPNVGYDFMSWQRGLKLVEDPCLYDEVIICNDSVYAPIYPLVEMFEVMEASGAAYWGVTSNSEIASHIQSYFIAFRRPVLERKEFWQFWDRVSVQPSKRAVIEAYEIGLSSLLVRLGLSSATYFSIDELLNEAFRNFKCFSTLPLLISPPYYGSEPLDVVRLLLGVYNKTHALWKDMILARVPMIKIELLRDNPTDQQIDAVLASLDRYSVYPTQLLRAHLRRMRSGADEVAGAGGLQNRPS
jgi:lipopolysaccharide biosynthesis protein